MTIEKNLLEQKAVEIIDSIASNVKAVGEFAKEELPDVAQQFITFNIAWNSIALILWSVMLFICYKVFVKGDEERDDLIEDPAAIVRKLVSVLVGFVALIDIFINTKALTLFVFAPKVALLQTLVTMFK